jgi:Flp pilus assembly protein TadD
MDSKKATSTGEGKEIDLTIKTIEEHVEKGTTTGVATTISGWIKTLGDYPELKSIGGDLAKLKEAISANDGKKIVAIMTKLGIATNEAAESAEGTEATKIKHLGKALTTAAKAISKLI